MTALAAVAGYLIGSIPTASGLGRIWGVDLRRAGSGNPGANNAMRLGGPVLAATVLLVELAKGLAAVRIGQSLEGDLGAALAAIGAVAGNVYNVWYRLRGGKGLAITAGVLLGAAPLLLVPALATLVAVVIPTRSSSLASLAAIVTLDVGALAWWQTDWSVGWGVSPGPVLMLLAFGVTLVLWPRHVRETEVRRQLLR